MHLVGIPHCQPNIPDRKAGQLQQLRRFEHAVIQQEFLWRFPQCFLENFSEISAVQSADTGNIFNRDLILKVVFNVGQCLVNVEFPQFAAVFQLFICRRTQKIIQKQIEMPDQMKRRLIFVTGDVQHFVCHVLPQAFVSGMIDRFVQRKPDGVQQGLHTESVEFQPDVFPRQLLVGNIGGDLIGEDHEPLHAFDRVGLGDTLAVVCHQGAGAG